MSVTSPDLWTPAVGATRSRSALHQPGSPADRPALCGIGAAGCSTTAGRWPRYRRRRGLFAYRSGRTSGLTHKQTHRHKLAQTAVRRGQPRAAAAAPIQRRLLPRSDPSDGGHTRHATPAVTPAVTRHAVTRLRHPAAIHHSRGVLTRSSAGAGCGRPATVQSAARVTWASVTLARLLRDTRGPRIMTEMRRESAATSTRPLQGRRRSQGAARPDGCVDSRAYSLT